MRTYQVPRDKHDALVMRARALRRRLTLSEEMLWGALRHDALGVRFRRQAVVGPFIVDFLCLPLHLVVEVDGPVHATQAETDAERRQFLEKLGYRVLRLPSALVEKDRGAALSLILQAMREARPTKH